MATKVYSKSAILEATFQLSLQKGFEAISMRMIARKLGCSVMPIYDSFDSKEDLIKELSLFAITEAFEAIQSENFIERHLKLLEYGLTYPKFYMDFVKINRNYQASEELVYNLIKSMRKDPRLETLKTMDLSMINGQIEVFIVGVVYMYSLQGSVSEEKKTALLQATKKFINEFIDGFVYNLS